MFVFHITDDITQSSADELGTYGDEDVEDADQKDGIKVYLYKTVYNLFTLQSTVSVIILPCIMFKFC